MKDTTESILTDLQALEYALMCRPYGCDRINCHGHLGYILKLYRKLQRKTRVHLSQDVRWRWNSIKRIYFDMRAQGYFEPKITSCAVCNIYYMCEFKDYTKYTKYK